MYNGQNEYVPYKKRTKRSLNDHRVLSGTRPGNSVTCPVVDPFTTQVEQTSRDTYRISTGCRTYENRTNRTTTG